MQTPPLLRSLGLSALTSLYLKLDYRDHFEENCEEESQINKLYQIYAEHFMLPTVKL